MRLEYIESNIDFTYKTLHTELQGVLYCCMAPSLPPQVLDLGEATSKVA